MTAGELVGLNVAAANALNWRSSQYIFICSYRPALQRVEGLSGSYTVDGVEISQSNRGHAQIYCHSGTINVDSTAKTITFPTYALIASGIATVYLPEETVFDYSSESFFTFYIVYSSVTESFRSIAGSDIPSLKPTEFVIGMFNRTRHTFLEGVNDYLIDGKPHNLSKRGFATLAPVLPGNINYSTTDSTLTFTNTVTALTERGVYNINTPVTLDLTANRNYRIEVNETSKDIRCVPGTSGSEDNWLFCGAINKTRDGITTNAFSGYLVDGAPSFMHGKTVYGTMLSTSSSLNFNFDDRKIEITDDTQLPFAGYRLLVPPQEVSMASITNRFWWLVAVNPTTLEVSVIPANTSNDMLVILGAIQRDGKVAGFIDYSINGQPMEDILSEDPDNADKRINPIMIDTPVEGLYQTDNTYDDLPNFREIKSSEVYGLWDDLMSSFPEYISKQPLGNDAFGNAIALYRLSPTRPVTFGEPYRIPKILLTSGIHGGEDVSGMVTYCLVEALCNKWREDPLLEALRFNVEFLIIPVTNPSGWDARTRKNGNGVDLNRNYPYKWTAGDPTSVSYGGTTPLSELETQYVDQVLDENRDIDAFYDVHNYGRDGASGGSGESFIWLSLTPGKIKGNLSRQLIQKLTRLWKGRYSWLPDDESWFAGYSTGSSDGLGPYTGSHAYIQYGIELSGTFEVCNVWKLQPEGSFYSPEQKQAAVETFINWMLLNVQEIVNRG